MFQAGRWLNKVPLRWPRIVAAGLGAPSTSASGPGSPLGSRPPNAETAFSEDRWRLRSWECDRTAPDSPPRAAAKAQCSMAVAATPRRADATLAWADESLFRSSSPAPASAGCSHRSGNQARYTWRLPASRRAASGLGRTLRLRYSRACRRARRSTRSSGHFLAAVDLLAANRAKPALARSFGQARDTDQDFPRAAGRLKSAEQRPALNARWRGQAHQLWSVRQADQRLRYAEAAALRRHSRTSQARSIILGRQTSSQRRLDCCSGVKTGNGARWQD